MNRKILFVSGYSEDRSPTAADLLKNVNGFEVQSAGTHRGSPTELSKELIDWADYIFVMKNCHVEDVVKRSPEAKKKTHVLNVPVW